MFRNIYLFILQGSVRSLTNRTRLFNMIFNLKGYLPYWGIIIYLSVSSSLTSILGGPSVGSVLPTVASCFMDIADWNEFNILTLPVQAVFILTSDGAICRGYIFLKCSVGSIKLCTSDEKAS